MRSYVIHLLKRYIPVYAVTGAILFSLFLSLVVNNEAAYSWNITMDGSRYYRSAPSSDLLVFFIPLALLSIIAPLFANTYRYSIKSVDVFYQVGKGDKKIRYLNNLVLWIGIVVIYTVLFLTSMLMLFIKQLPLAGQTVTTERAEYHYIMFNFGYYILAYLLLVIFSSLNYFISCYLVTRSNNLVNSMLTLYLGELLLIALLMTPFWYVYAIITRLGHYDIYNANFVFGARTLSIVSPVSWLYYLFDPLIVGKEITMDNRDQTKVSLALGIVFLALFVILSIVCIFAFFKEKESSGEYAGKPAGRDKLQSIIFHTAFALIALWLGFGYSIFSSFVYGIINYISLITTFVVFGALYYVFTGLINRNFKLNKKQLILYFSVMGIYVVSAVVNIVVSVIASNH